MPRSRLLAMVVASMLWTGGRATAQELGTLQWQVTVGSCPVTVTLTVTQAGPVSQPVFAVVGREEPAACAAPVPLPLHGAILQTADGQLIGTLNRTPGTVAAAGLFAFLLAGDTLSGQWQLLGGSAGLTGPTPLVVGGPMVFAGAIVEPPPTP